MNNRGSGAVNDKQHTEPVGESAGRVEPPRIDLPTVEQDKRSDPPAAWHAYIALPLRASAYITTQPLDQLLKTIRIISRNLKSDREYVHAKAVEASSPHPPDCFFPPHPYFKWIYPAAYIQIEV